MQTSPKIIPLGTDLPGTDWRETLPEMPAPLPQLHAVLDWLPQATAFIDSSGHVRACNAAFAAGLERSREQIIDRIFIDCLSHRPDSAIAQAQSALEQAWLGNVSSFPLNNHLMAQCQPKTDDSGTVQGCFVSYDRLSLSSDWLNEAGNEEPGRNARYNEIRTLADSLPLAVGLIDQIGKFILVNQSFCHLWQEQESAVVGQPLDQIFKGESAFEVIQHFKTAVAGQISEYEYLDAKASLGNPRWRRVLLIPRHGPEGAVNGVLVVGLDIHEAKTSRINAKAHEANLVLEKTVAETERTLNSIDTPVAIVDPDIHFEFANKSMLDSYQLQRADFVGKHVSEILQAKDYEQSLPHIQKALEGEEVAFMREFRFPDNTTRWVRVRYVPRKDDHGRNNGFYVVLFDIHDLKTQQRILQMKQEELRRTSWLLSSHLDNSPLAALELDAELRIRRWSDRAEEHFGWRRDQVIGRSIWELNLVASGESDALGRSFALVMTVKEQQVCSLQRITRHDGAKLWCEWYLSALLDQNGELISIFALVHDVNQRIQAEARLQQLAAYDALTGLPNRSSLQFELTQALDRARRRNDTGVAALFIDLDHFKNVNDTLGHRVGDQLLLAVAKILKSCVRKRDVVSRMGGDEFMIVIEHSKVQKAAQHVASKLLSALNQPLPIEGHMLTVAASVGIAVFPEHGSDANTLLKNSDVAMYHAKARGKNRFEFYSDELAREREELAFIESSLRLAMSADQLDLHYQPRVSCQDGSIDGAEALLRWTHTDLGTVAPKKFIRVAEETGLIFELGIWVFRRACVQLQKWQSQQLPVKCLSINFSAQQLLMNDLAERVGAVLVETGCDARLIEIEITETSMLFDLTVIKRVVSSLKKLGLRIAIDDFGTGFSSLSHLQQLDIDTLKIDQSFVRDLLQDSGDAAITRTVISLGRGLGLQVIAEGVENAQQLAFLQHCGCDLYQGYHFSPAIPVDQFEALLLARR